MQPGSSEWYPLKDKRQHTQFEIQKFQLNIRRVFTVRVLSHRCRMLQAAVQPPSVEVFKTQGDTVLSTLL